MKYTYTSKDTISKIILTQNEELLERYYHQKESGYKYYTIAWNKGKTQKVTIDEVAYNFGLNCILPIMMSQSFIFEKPEDITLWQFNRDFYCIVNHDAQVGCVGFLFYGPTPVMFLELDEEHSEKMHRLMDLFEEEFISEEEIKEDMLRMLLVRFIIKLTRLAKKQYPASGQLTEEKYDLLRQYNLEVERHYRKEHQVQFYAGLLNKSPKTIANIFSLYGSKTPLQVIHERIIAEARRLFFYTDKSVKEIADYLGFTDAAHFSKFFKKHTLQNPSDLKRNVKTGL